MGKNLCRSSNWLWISKSSRYAKMKLRITGMQWVTVLCSIRAAFHHRAGVAIADTVTIQPKSRHTQTQSSSLLACHALQ